MFGFRHLISVFVILLALLSGVSTAQETQRFGGESVAIVVLDVFESGEVVEVPVSHSCDPDEEHYDEATNTCVPIDDEGEDDIPNCAVDISGQDDYQYTARFYSTLLKPFQDPHGRLIFNQYQSFLRELGAVLYPPIDPGWDAELFQEWRLPDNTRIYLIGVNLFVKDKPYESGEIRDRILEIVNHRTLYNIPLPPIENFIFSMSFALLPCNEHALITAHDYACEIAKEEYDDIRDDLEAMMGEALPSPEDCPPTEEEPVDITATPTPVAMLTPTLAPPSETEQPVPTEDLVDHEGESTSELSGQELIAILSHPEFKELHANVVFNYGRPRLQDALDEYYPEDLNQVPEFLIGDPLFELPFDELGSSIPQTLTSDLAQAAANFAVTASNFSGLASAYEDSFAQLAADFVVLAAEFEALIAVANEDTSDDDLAGHYSNFAERASSFAQRASNFAAQNADSGEVTQSLTLLASNFDSLASSSDEPASIIMALAAQFATLTNDFATLANNFGDDAAGLADDAASLADGAASLANEISDFLAEISSQASFVPSVDVVAIAAAGNKGRNYPYAPAMASSILSVSAEYGGVEACHRMLSALPDVPLDSNAGEVMMTGFYDCLPGTSFAVPRMGIEMAIYLLMGGSSGCDETNPPLAYVPDWINPPARVDLTTDPLTGVNLTREDASNQFCPNFNTLVDQFYSTLP